MVQVKKAMLINHQRHHLCVRWRCPDHLPRMEMADTSDRLQLVDEKGRNRGRGQCEGMEATGKDKCTVKRICAAADQCPRKEDGNWHGIRRAGHAHGDQQNENQGQVLPMWQSQALQEGLSKEPEDKGRGTMMTQLLLGPSCNRGKNGLQDWRGKRWGQAVNNSTDSATDLVSSGTHSSPASQAYCTSVVNTHSNIPTRWWASRLCTLRIRGIYPCITQYLRNDTIIIPTHFIILPTLDNSMDFRSISHKHPDTILQLWHPLLTHSVILPSSPRITITVSHHGKAPWSTIILKRGCYITQKHLVDAHQSFNEMTWLTQVPSQLRQLQLRQL